MPGRVSWPYVPIGSIPVSRTKRYAGQRRFLTRRSTSVPDTCQTVKRHLGSRSQNERLAMTTTTTPPVPLPAGALADDVWQEDDRPRRIIHSENRGVEGQDLVVWWDATQFADGTLDIEGNP